VSQHRAPRRRADRRRPAARSASSPSASPSSSATPAASSGRHRAGSTPTPEAPPAFTRDRRRFRPSGFLVAGTSAIVVAAAGAMSIGSAQAAHLSQASTVQALNADGGSAAASDGPASDALGSQLDRDGRPSTISRNADRVALDQAQQQRMEHAAEQQAAARNQALAELASKAEDRAREIKSNMWVLPVDHYDITATFGSGGSLWSSDHTGLDFAAPVGTPIHAVAHGVVTQVGYAGAYGNRVIITHADGTETWYCHMNDFAVSTGDEVESGETVGHIGITGNTTGPHLHLEVRPTPNVPVDPYTALIAHGVHP
jgi:murein DD-endopeptidase MepM/ murein hydrolase activator NlpD